MDVCDSLQLRPLEIRCSNDIGMDGGILLGHVLHWCVSLLLLLLSW